MIVDKASMIRGLAMIPDAEMLKVREAEYLYDTAAKFVEPVVWVELGSWCGRSLWAAGCGLPEHSDLDAFDPCTAILPATEGSDQCFVHGDGLLQWSILNAVTEAIFRLARVEAKHHRKRSIEGAAHYADSSVDVLMIDADHRYESVRDDLATWLPKLTPGGLVIGHDYTRKNPGVMQAFNERFGDKCRAVTGTRFVEVRV